MADYLPEPIRKVELGETYYVWFSLNDVAGSGDDGSALTVTVREGGATASDAPLVSPTPSLLSHASFPDGCYEAAIVVTTANGFAIDKDYGVFVTATVSSVTPSGFLGRFST